MKENIFKELSLLETDVEGALKRFYNDKKLYLSFLEDFSHDQMLRNLFIALDDNEWDKAFMIAHALKGVTLNLGLIPLSYAVGELVYILRIGQINEISKLQTIISKYYTNVINVLHCSI